MNEEGIKYIRLQVEGHTIVEFVNGSRACSCGLERGKTPNLRNTLMDTRAGRATRHPLG